jgi:hypothetical protein
MVVGLNPRGAAELLGGMKKNVGMRERSFRLAGGAAVLVAAAVAPLPLAIRLAALGVPGIYLLVTAVARRCFGYGLMGRSSCRTDDR